MRGIVFAAVILHFMTNVATFKIDRALPEEAPSTPDHFCDQRCRGSCYVLIEDTTPMEWTGADRACRKRLDGGHLANIYTKSCFHAIRHYLISQSTAGEILIGMTYQQNPSGNSNRVNLYNSDETVRNPMWYRRRPNRVGEREMVMIVGKDLKYSGIRNTLNSLSHHKILCEA